MTSTAAPILLGWGAGEALSLLRTPITYCDNFDVRAVDVLNIGTFCTTGGADVSDVRMRIIFGSFEEGVTYPIAYETPGVPASSITRVALDVKEWVLPVNTVFGFQVPIAAQLAAIGLYYSGGADPTTITALLQVFRQSRGV